MLNLGGKVHDYNPNSNPRINYCQILGVLGPLRDEY